MGGTSYGYYENHGHVRTKGYNLSLLYSFSHWFDIGGTFNSIDTRDYEKFLAGSSLQESMHYKVRMPNLPIVMLISMQIFIGMTCLSKEMC